MTRLLLTKPENLIYRQSGRRNQLAASCSEMTAPFGLIRDFAGLLKSDETNPERLETWIRAKCIPSRFQYLLWSSAEPT
ncbi:hypothetical protein [Arthrobacter sp. W4I7]|uniref:hypothetical protein n=1 Tax=Arthrobacter sp. W4I7 TaxID=3042296 RepID=UPI0027818748|nr:hypothetical protein [Arthrobacter sp. W4I7]MDQ0691421.1 hypothetical protein [Arthrobacter sp. W4I7]